MGEFTDKLKGNVKEAKGKIKQESDNPRTRQEGRDDEVKGKARQTIGKVKGALGDDV